MTAKRAAIVALVLAVAALAADSAWAQCAMCRTALEQNGEVAAGFNRAILFLLVMPYLVFGSIAGSWYWKRRKSGGALGRPGPAQ
jgi:uncharacterized membrane protein YphA (DoxX/SURF4 family)